MAHRIVLTERQRATLFDLPTNEAALLRHYTLADDDIEFIQTRRRAHNRFGFALQLCVLRFPGRLLAPGEVIPQEVSRFLAAQLGLKSDDLMRYAAREETRHEHLAALRNIYGYKMFSGRDRATAHPPRILSAMPIAPTHGPQTETPMTQDALQDEFIKLRDEAIWLRQTVNTFNCLFDSGPETERILKESAGLFFGDLNMMMQEYTILLVCRLTGPAQSFGKANLSTQRFTTLTRDRGCLTPEIESLDARPKPDHITMDASRNWPSASAPRHASATWRAHAPRRGSNRKLVNISPVRRPLLLRD